MKAEQLEVSEQIGGSRGRRLRTEVPGLSTEFEGVCRCGRKEQVGEADKKNIQSAKMC